ncbi:MAG: hypothetical protein KJP18_02790 [Gemmatimonadetes bacterium]|nr:hypothetical protein [Gemmatimonadota bacterium]NNF37337.1 hypothetical protein [Gemmatimonadota bacterium]
MARFVPLRFAPCVLVFSLTACGGAADAAPEGRASSSDPMSADAPAAVDRTPAVSTGADVLGTIEATIDGEARTWYVVTGSVRGEPYASAVWYETPEGELIASIGGYDTADLPFDTFETDPSRGVSTGDYDGSAVTIVIMPGAGAGPYQAVISEEAPGLTYAPDAGASGIDGVFFGRSGSLEVTRLGVVGDRLDVEGTFEGTVRMFSGQGAIEVAEGRFSVRGVPARSALGGA